jgi:hypothetical protein
MKSVSFLFLLMVFLVGQSAAQRAGAPVPAELIGQWSNGTISMITEVNTLTGSATPGNGSTFTYKFFADGRFEFVGLMQSTMYGCTTGLFNQKKGRVVIDGSQITFISGRNFWRNNYSCSPHSNKEREYVLDKETYTWRAGEDEYGKQQICLADVKGETCYRRREK